MSWQPTPQYGTHRGDGLVHRDQIGVVRRRQRTGGARLHAFAAGDAGGYTHRVGEVEHDLRVRATKRVADHVVDLLFATGAYASRALDAGVEIDRHRRMREIGRRLRRAPRSAARRCSAIASSGPAPSRACRPVPARQRPAFRSRASANACARGCRSRLPSPSSGARQHDGASTRSPLISTMQARQLPSARMPSL